MYKQSELLKKTFKFIIKYKTVEIRLVLDSPFLFDIFLIKGKV
jgi:hypothetical protein